MWVSAIFSGFFELFGEIKAGLCFCRTYLGSQMVHQTARRAGSSHLDQVLGQPFPGFFFFFL